MNALITVWAKELTDLFRDRRTMMVSLLMGPLLMPALILGIGKLASDRVTTQLEKPLEVPPDLTSPTVDQRFAVPDPRASTSYSQYSKDKSATPVGTPAAAAYPQVLPAVPNARIERAGDQRWIIAKAEPGPVYAIAREFWLDLGFALARETPEAGIIETNWYETRANIETTGFRGVLSRALPGMYSTGESDRFRTRIEKGLEPGTTEIYVSHRGMEEVYVASQQEQTRWVPRGNGTDRDLEAEMLARLVVKLGEPSRKAAPATRPDTAPSIVATAAPITEVSGVCARWTDRSKMSAVICMMESLREPPPVARNSRIATPFFFSVSSAPSLSAKVGERSSASASPATSARRSPQDHWLVWV